MYRKAQFERFCWICAYSLVATTAYGHQIFFVEYGAALRSPLQFMDVLRFSSNVRNFFVLASVNRASLAPWALAQQPRDDLAPFDVLRFLFFRPVLYFGLRPETGFGRKPRSPQWLGRALHRLASSQCHAHEDISYERLSRPCT